MRFLLANTVDFNPNNNTVAFKDLTAVDKYFYIRFNEIKKNILEAYEKYNFQEIYKIIINFINVDLSSFYLDFTKDILYVEAPNSNIRRSVQTILYKILTELKQLLLPILPHTTEEIHEHLQYENTEFAYLGEMPKVEKINDEINILEKWNKFMILRNSVNKALEIARDKKLIGKPSEASITLYLNEEQNEFIKSLGQDIRVILMVSQLYIQNEENINLDYVEYDGYKILVNKANGKMSIRDRMYHTDLGFDKEFPMLSKHESEIIREYYPEVLIEGFED